MGMNKKNASMMRFTIGLTTKRRMDIIKFMAFTNLI